MIEKPESDRWREGGMKKALTHGTWSSTVVVSQYGLFLGLVGRTSIGRSDVVSSLGSTNRSSRISCMSGSWGRIKRNLSVRLLAFHCRTCPPAEVGGERGSLLHRRLRARWRPPGPMLRVRVCWGSRMLLSRRTPATHAFVGREALRGARAAAASRRPICGPLLVLRTKSLQFQLSQTHKAGARKGRQETHYQTESGQFSSPASSMT